MKKINLKNISPVVKTIMIVMFIVIVGAVIILIISSKTKVEYVNSVYIPETKERLGCIQPIKAKPITITYSVGTKTIKEKVYVALDSYDLKYCPILNGAYEAS